MVRQQEEMRALVVRPIVTVDNGNETLVVNPQGVIVNNLNGNPSGATLNGNPSGATLNGNPGSATQNGNPGGQIHNANAGLNQNGNATVNLGNPTGNNQGVPLMQIMGNHPPPTPTRKNNEQPFIQLRSDHIPVQQHEEDNYEDWMSNDDEPTEANKNYVCSRSVCEPLRSRALWASICLIWA